MAYNDKTLKTDLEGKPIPQAYNPDIDDYEPVHSTNNALNQVIYGSNGQPISTVGNKLAVRATELEALMQGFATEGKLEQVRALLQNVSDKDFAKDETLEQVRALLNTLSTKDFATSSNQDALKTVVDDLKSELLLVKSELDSIKQNQTSGDQKVQLSGNLVQARSPGLVTRVLKYPDPARPKVSITTSPIQPQVFAKDAETGREYTIMYGGLRYNDNDGQGNWPIMWTTPEDRKSVRNARRLSNGRILVVLKQDGGPHELWASDLSEDTAKTFEKVLEFSNGYPYGPWGWDTTHEEVLLCSEYREGNTNRAYMSQDEGLSWIQIFEGPVPTDGSRFHIHSIAYDPYHSTIWIVTGDGKWRNIYYSYDWGNVWHSFWEEGMGLDFGTGVQFLSISVMPHCILFGTDSKPDGIWRLQKTWRKGSYPKYTAADLEYVYAVYEEDYPGISQIFHSPVVVDGIHYHATWTSTNDRLYSHIIATPDGEHFYDVFKSKPFTQAMRGVRSLTTDGKALIGAYMDEDNVFKRFYMPLPDWKAV